MRLRIVASAAALAAAAIVSGAAAQPRPYSLTLYSEPDYRGASVTFYGDNANVGSTGFADRAQSAQVIGSWRLCAGGGYRNRCEVLTGNVRDLAALDLSNRVGSAQLLSAESAAYVAPAPALPQGYSGPAYVPPEGGPPVAVAPTYAAPIYETPEPPVQRGDGYGGYGRDRDYGRAYPPSDQVYVQAPPEGGYAEPPAVDVPPPRYPSQYPAQAYAAPPAAYPPQTYEAPAQAYAAPPPGLDGQATVFFPHPMVQGREASYWGPGAADGFCRSQGLGGAVYFDQQPGATISGQVLRDVLCRRS